MICLSHLSMLSRSEGMPRSLMAAAILLTLSYPTLAQSTSAFQYFYDDLGQLIKVIDSSGNEIDYTYDLVGNIIQVTRATAPAATALAILNFTPQSGGVGTTVTIQGQNFGATAAANAVSFNGAAATVQTASANTLTVAVPSGASTGPISVTVAGQTTKSSTNFTFIPGPAVLSVAPQSILSSSTAITLPNFRVTGSSLTGSTFSFLPAFSPPPVTINSANISVDGTSAALSLAIAPNAVGSFLLVATNASGVSGQVSTAANTLQIISPDTDSDGDGLTNIVETAIGTNPLNAFTLGDGLPDGWQVFYGLSPLDPTNPGKDLDGSGLTVLQDFRLCLSPLNPNRAAPSVSQAIPANNATAVAVNTAIVAHFSEPLLVGTTLTAAQSAITKALGAGTTVPAGSQQIAGQTLLAYMNRSCAGNSVTPGTVTIRGPSGPVAGNIRTSPDGTWATFVPTMPLQSNTKYTIRIAGVRDAAGNPMTTPFTSAFTTGSTLDQTAPQIKSTSPVDGAISVPSSASISVTFTKAIDPSSVTAASFQVVDASLNTPLSGAIQESPDDTTVTFVPSQALSVNHFFSITLAPAITDQAQNPLQGSYSFGFTTGAITKETDSSTFSLLNGTGTVLNLVHEVDSATFSLLNGLPSTQGMTAREADSATFSLLNGSAPPPLVAHEVDTSTFSLLDSSGPVIPSQIPFESDSLTFSLLNGEPSSTGVAVYEVDSATFSLHNAASTAEGAAPPRAPELDVLMATATARPSVCSGAPGALGVETSVRDELHSAGLTSLAVRSPFRSVWNRLLHRRAAPERHPNSQTSGNRPNVLAHPCSRSVSNNSTAGSEPIASSGHS
jgi:YD repeat-containing protein